MDTVTKKDGDRLRAMQAELEAMAEQYDEKGELTISLGRIHYAITLTLLAKEFRVKRTARQMFIDDRNAALVTNSRDLPPAA